jgi:hypothetical protein
MHEFIWYFGFFSLQETTNHGGGYVTNAQRHLSRRESSYNQTKMKAYPRPSILPRALSVGNWCNNWDSTQELQTFICTTCDSVLWVTSARL